MREVECAQTIPEDIVAYENNIPFANEIYVLTLMLITKAKLQYEADEEEKRAWISCTDPAKMNGLLFYSISPEIAESLLKRGDIEKVNKSPNYLHITLQGYVRALSQYSSTKHPA